MNTQGIGYGQLFLLNLDGYTAGSYLCNIKSYGSSTVNINLLDFDTLKKYEQTGDSQTLTISEVLNSEVTDSNSGSPSGGGASIIYTTELPSTPQQAIYVVTQDEVKKVEIVQSGIILPPEYGYVEVVDALPEFGTVTMDLQTQYMYGYYLTTDGILYGYIDTAFSEATGGQLPVGWMPISNLFVLFGTTDGGLITSLDQATDESALYFLLTTEPRTRVYVPMPDGAFLELTTGIRTRFDANNGTVSITEM